MQAKVDKECVKLTLKLMRIIVMSSFCANSNNQELTLHLERRISSAVQETEDLQLFDDDKKGPEVMGGDPSQSKPEQLVPSKL